jgi:hypothetical protein
MEFGIDPAVTERIPPGAARAGRALWRRIRLGPARPAAGPDGAQASASPRVRGSVSAVRAASAASEDLI